jgi:ribosomal protein S18 acetylase RimI-like enzyme
MEPGLAPARRRVGGPAGMTTEVEELGPGDDDKVTRAAHLFDDSVDAPAVRAFLTDPRHHLLIAFVDGESVGFVSAIELLHPDKHRPEMFIYELAVDDRYRRRGVATAMLARLKERCVERGCREMFVLTDEANEAAMRTYRAAGGGREPDSVMFLWSWPDA